jgi:hypothetical protein
VRRTLGFASPDYSGFAFFGDLSAAVAENLSIPAWGSLLSARKQTMNSIASIVPDDGVDDLHEIFEFPGGTQVKTLSPITNFDCETVG